MNSAQELVTLAVSEGGLGNDALLAAVLPLFRQTAEIHERGLVAPLRGLDRLTLDERSRLSFPAESAVRPVLEPGAVRLRERRSGSAIEVVTHQRQETDLGAGASDTQVRVVSPEPSAITAPVLVSGWQSWEHVVGHHDPLTDIFSLGQLLVGLGCGLDLGLDEDVARLIVARGNLFVLRPDLHPVIASVASQMAEPDRHRRAQDLRSVIGQLENYRDQPLDFDVTSVTRGAADRRAAVLAALRDRLFDLSRRNRLVNFRHTAQSLNLTEVSVPLMLDVRNIRADHLFTWNRALSKRLLGGGSHSLGRWIRYDEAPYAAGTLDKLISTARRDRAEYGQDQLRLVPAFLRWHDLRNDHPAKRGGLGVAPQENVTTRLASPLLLVKVELAKKRGVRDSYTLKVTDPVAEVNPTLRQHLRQLYAIELPAFVDLSEPHAIDGLHALLSASVKASEPGLTLHLRDKPRIDMVRHRAMVRLRSYRRRQHGNRAGEFGSRQYGYSYRRADYQPLGVQIFRTQLAEQDLPLGVLLGEEPAPRSPAVVETDLYTLDAGDEGSPYSWDIDLCAVALANFNYRTLGLVRDYDELLATGRSCASFEQLFSDEPRPLVVDPGELPTADRHLVVPADGSQVAALARARQGVSFVIQGPPGTGKSQTITNMIADFAARGKRVLFVCQKRAALDVVHARLAARQLSELCTLIHDSQADKRAFVHGLRDTYERWLSAADDLPALAARRDQIVARVDELLGTVERFEAALATRPMLQATSAREVVNRLAELRDRRWGDDLPAELRRLLPTPAEWWPDRATVTALSRSLAASPATEGVVAKSPLAALAPEVWTAPNADAEVPVRAARVRSAWATVETALEALADEHRADGWVAEPVSRLRMLGALGETLLPLAERGRAGAIDPGSPAAAELRHAIRQLDVQATAARSAWEAAAGWRDPLPPADARAALVVAERKEGSFFGFLSGDWRRVKALVAERYHASVRPKVTEALRTLVAAQEAGAAARESAERAERDWGTADLAGLAERLAALARDPDPELARWRSALAADPTPTVAGSLARVATALRSADDAARGFLVDELAERSLGEVRATADYLTDPRLGPAIRSLAPGFSRLAATPATVQVAVRSLAGSPEQIEYAVCAAYWQRARAAAPVLGHLTSPRLDDIVGQLGAAYDELTKVNARVVVAGIRSRFLTELAHSQLGVSGMTDEDRARKKTFSAGRRILEHEFGKTMRYKSIRDLSSGDPGAVVALLRPVWLMSPSSVSDTLPLDATFDVVIYDEASQIPIEEAIPALHRAPQVVVVGDQMQLPPTQYFRVAPLGPDEDEDDADEVGVVLDSDSFLAISALRLPSTMLTWHYRSRSEALISFSNAAFYQGRLATIPDRLPARVAPPWTVQADATHLVDELVDGVLAGSITSVRVLDGVYRHRRNPAEASWIAAMVRDLLSRDTGASIGVVAFSEAQQTEIEGALEELAQADPEFATRYEAELVRTEDDQDVSLFVKNLENVQGDERDIVIMSVCYAAGPDGRMLMNFGPINTAGGEKRLNVIFSRARRHMVIVSSIAPDAITNTYNDGANTLRRFLGYADAVSRGDTTAARAVLAPYATGRRPTGTGQDKLAAVEQLVAALRAHGGIEVSTDVGESVFRCDLALSRPGDPGHRLAVLVDTPERIAADSLLERLSTHQRALTTGGWQVRHVLVSDWIHNPDDVIRRLIEALD